ncbi:FabD/lysophospholipase-like protein [Aulographum hederae CBS 113979]|uniref:FabD/lysophospholipase-like protein n=1 Tax=Aulographum hederae CBS 113979 TaxID=1176131 RepID=A0A6G1GS40_9PEZI|nr:FabD/lysophospholipase-like protein [Aulographum hederae CBS 113979]
MASALSLASASKNTSRPRSILSSNPDDDEHTGKTWARTVEDPWDPMILTLDGGGIRGYSSLIILRRLMHEISVWERKFEEEEQPVEAERRTFDEDDLLPCHYFDFMYGTSTGGLIATMLGRLRMTVPHCLAVYRTVGDDLFGKKRSSIPLKTKYHHTPLESAVKRLVREHCPVHRNGTCDGEDWFPWHVDEETLHKPLDSDEPLEPAEPPEPICQTICLTAIHNGTITEAHLLRTWPHNYVGAPNWVTSYNAGAEPLRIWQVTRATSAAPFYFDQLELDIRNEKRVFKDGGIRENNPSSAAWNEFISIYGEYKDPGLLLSIGTGRPDESQDGFASAWPGPLGESSFMKKTMEKMAVFRNLLIKYTEGERTHDSMKKRARGENTWYKRLNVSEGLQTVRLDNWERGPYKDPKTGIETTIPGGASLTRMEQVTETYLAREFVMRFDAYAAPAVKIQQAAEKLVRQRRAREKGRARDPRRWETFLGMFLREQPTRIQRHTEAPLSTIDSGELCVK